MQRFVHSKWKKTQALVVHPGVAAHIPSTKPFRKDTLANMLARYGMVYMKPDRGAFGNGVMRVEGGKGHYRYQIGTTIRTFTGYDAFYEALKRETRNRPYLVQKGIRLLKHNGRRFDIRVMVQKSPGGRWESTGMIGRVAHPRKIVTNYHNGGQLRSVPVLMAPYMEQMARARFEARLKVLGVTVARQLEARYPGIQEIGLDIAVDPKLKPWILEVNTCPDPYIFKALKNKDVFRKVYSYAKAYGRIKTRKK